MESSFICDISPSMEMDSMMQSSFIDTSCDTVLDPQTQLGYADNAMHPIGDSFDLGKDTLGGIMPPEYQSPLDLSSTGGSTLDILINSVDAEIQATNDLLLPDEMVLNAVHEACDFFGIQEVPVINAEQTCVWAQDCHTAADDVLGFNRAQLMNQGVSGQESLTLVYTHECAHRALQGIPNLDHWEHELACDYFAGIHAGIDGMDTDNFISSLNNTPGSDSHPSGVLREAFIAHGVAVAQEMQSEGNPITFENCLNHFNDYLAQQDTEIAEQRHLYGIDSNSGGDQPTGEALGMYSDAEIRSLRDKVDEYASKVRNHQSEVSHREKLLGTANDNLRAAKYSDNIARINTAINNVEQATSNLNRAKSDYNYDLRNLNAAKSRLNNAT